MSQPSAENVQDKEWQFAARAAAQTATPLFFAVCDGRTSEVEKLLQGAGLNDVCWNGYTSLYVACQRQHLHLVRLLLSRGADPNAARLHDSDTPLHIACQEGSLAAVDLLLKAGANIAVQRSNKQTVRNVFPLKVASRVRRH